MESERHKPPGPQKVRYIAWVYNRTKSPFLPPLPQEKIFKSQVIDNLLL